LSAPLDCRRVGPDSSQAFLSITPAAAYLVAGLLLTHGTGVSAGTVVAFTTLQTRLYFPIGQLLQVSVELRTSLALFDRVFEYMDVTPDIVDAPDAVDLPAARHLLHGAAAIAYAFTPQP
jgi:ATP-binding cassette subfamily B protein